MLNNVVLDVFIGLVFIFLLYSLLATVLLEIIGQWFSLRARMLRKAIRRMLEDDSAAGVKTNNAFTAFWITGWENLLRFFKPSRENETLLNAFYKHPTIRFLGESRLNNSPGYLKASNFSQTIIQLLRGTSYDGISTNESTLISNTLQNSGTNDIQISKETLAHLKMLFADSRGDSSLFKRKLEEWFEETMERCTGWFKKQNQTILFFIGFGIACSFNVDTIAISRILIKDRNIRENLVKFAASKQETYGGLIDTLAVINITSTTTDDKSGSKTTTGTTKYVIQKDLFLQHAYQQLSSDAEAVQGVLGLKGITNKTDSLECEKYLSTMKMIIDTTSNQTKKAALQELYSQLLDLCTKKAVKKSPCQSSFPVAFLGWVLTALAISLGAPFWFDLLNKFMKIRNAGTKPTPQPVGNSSANNPSGTNPLVDANNQVIKG